MQIVVTEEDIRTGVPRNPMFCAVAKAIDRAVNKFVYVRAGRVSIGGVRVSLPAEVNQWIMNFDSFGAVNPITFELDYTPNNT